MATITSDMRSDIDRERAFFLKMALAMAAVIVAGFSFNLAAGRSSFSVSPIYHIHAFVFFGWLTLYVTQNVLVVTGRTELHRTLGWLALAWIPMMIGMGMALTLHSIRTTGGPFFFDTNEFLFGNSLGVIAFGGTAIAAIILRRRSDWHRRLMCCAMASLTGPGFGRLLPMPFLIPWAWWVASVGVPMIFALIGMHRDWRHRGRVHPAWLWAVGGLVASQVVADLVAYSPAGIAITHSVVAGTPGAARTDMRAHFP
ncbi:hypothetical protein [Sphingobium nicotianae]|uniref:DUF2306 domain-containing protein n=1 Tax=Sphingobium nicotianae TaxID=2782607 RepID=A0A9X1D9E4_9SPHN|nr:hypothetical protein [Sphingobium nicotianae]MBT2185526.1 hypothetical protein [Sphingobium nicotianae]